MNDWTAQVTVGGARAPQQFCGDDAPFHYYILYLYLFLLCHYLMNTEFHCLSSVLFKHNNVSRIMNMGGSVDANGPKQTFS